LEIARELSRAGAHVVMAARNEARLAERAAEISAETGNPVDHFAVDVGNEDQVAAFVDFVQHRHAQVHVLVNNAYHTGNTRDLHPLDVPHSAWLASFEVNVLGPYRLVQAFGRTMMDRDGGSIINIVSGSGFLPTPAGLVYGSTKSALWMMTKYLSVELAPSVRVNAVCPGLTMSDTGGPRATANVVQYAVAQTPMGRAAHPSEVAPAVLYLASEAASYTTGALLVVNGGRPWG
jgi:NAD(P)-dependent dehydrogenase (short-subunit alcohol dehydrogenase family)